MTQITMVHGRVRAEERMLLEAAEKRGVKLRPVHDGSVVLNLDGGGLGGDVVLQRSLSATRSQYLARGAAAADIPSINDAGTIATCSDKAETSWRLRKANIPTPETRVAFDRASALTAIAEVGYPAVLKPVQGSWARLVARVDDPSQAEQILEHREMLPNPLQHVLYVQQYIEKRREGFHRDLRAFVIGDRTVAAVWRRSPHWVTNTARGAVTENCPVTPDLDDLCVRAADAVGGGVLAIDLMPLGDGYTVHEVNHSMEFRNSIDVTGVDIPGHVIDHCVEVARR